MQVFFGGRDKRDVLNHVPQSTGEYGLDINRMSRNAFLRHVNKMVQDPKVTEAIDLQRCCMWARSLAGSPTAIATAKVARARPALFFWAWFQSAFQNRKTFGSQERRTKMKAWNKGTKRNETQISDVSWNALTSSRLSPSGEADGSHGHTMSHRGCSVFWTCENFVTRSTRWKTWKTWASRKTRRWGDLEASFSRHVWKDEND